MAQRLDCSEPLPPSAEDIELYCAFHQAKLDLLMEEAQVMRACEETQQCLVSNMVRWTDIDGKTTQLTRHGLRRVKCSLPFQRYM